MKKWLCGVDENAPKPRKFLREEQMKLHKASTKITEDPWWATFMNVQAVLCGLVSIVLHAFWA